MPATPSRTRAARTPPDVRFGAAWAAGLYAIITLSLVYPILHGGYLVNPMADMYTGAAYRAFGAEFLRHTGHFAEWNPYLLGGLPFVDAQHGDMFYPVVLLRLIMPIDVAISLSFAVHVFLAGLFTYIFLRAYGFSFFAALVGGVGYMLAGQVASLVSPGHDGKLYVSALTPLLLWALVRGVRDGRLWAWGVVSLVTALAIVTPHYQLVYYLGLAAIAFTLYLAFRRDVDPLDPRVRLRRLGAAAAAAALGFVTAAIQLLPLFAYIPFSPRGNGGRGYEYASSWGMPPEELFGGYLPHFFGMLGNYWGRNPLKLHSDYLGAALLVLAGLAFGSTRHRGFTRFWLIVTVVGVIVAFGGYTPLYHLWYVLPMMKYVRAPANIYFVVCLAVATLAAVGVDRVLEDPKVPRGYLIGWAAFATGIALLATIGGLEGIAHVLAAPERYEAVTSNASAMVLGAWRSFAAVAAVIGLLAWYGRDRLTGAQLGWALALVVALDNWSVVREFFQFSPPASQIYRSDATIDYLEHLPQPGRVIALPLAELTTQGDPYLEGDALMFHHVRSLTGHQGNELQSWVELAGGKSPAPPTRVTSPQFRRLANAKYWLTDAQLPQVVPQLGNLHLTQRVGPVTDAVGNTVYLYEIDEDNPVAWLSSVVVKAPRGSILATVLDPRFDPRSAALFDSSLVGAGATVTAPPPPLATTVRATRYDPGHITLAIDQPAPAGSALVLSENYYPGWSARVDGRPAPVARVDYTFIGVPLPAGAHTVDLEFRDAPFEHGAWISAVALVCVLLTIAGGVVLEQRRRRG